MKSTITAALAAVSILALGRCKPAANSADNGATAGNASAATGAIDGTWKADLSSVQIDAKPDVLLLKDGTFSCSTCTPPLTLPADGRGEQRAPLNHRIVPVHEQRRELRVQTVLILRDATTRRRPVDIRQ